MELKLRDLREIDKQTQEYPILKDLVDQQKKTIAELKDSLDKERQLTSLQTQQLDLARQKEDLYKQQIEMKDKAFNDMKEVADRAIKLAEVSKSGSSIWSTIGLILGGVIAGIALAAAF